MAYRRYKDLNVPKLRNTLFVLTMFKQIYLTIQRTSLPSWRALSAVLSALVVLISTSVNAQGLIRDAEIESFLRDLGNPIFEAAGLLPEDVHIYIVGDDSLNAFVAGGQNMFLHTGLMKKVDTPEQLAGVMAHETGHISGGHLARLPDAMSGATAAMILTYILGAAAMVAGEGDAGMAILAGGQTIGQRTILAFSRGQESAADQAGLGFLESADVTGIGLVEFMETLADQEALSARRQDPYVRTHPLSYQRVASMRNRVEDSPTKDKLLGADFDKRLRRAQAKLVGFLDAPGAVFRKYPSRDTSIEARYAHAVAYHRQGLLEQALQTIDYLLLQEPENPYFHELKGQILFESGKAEASIKPHRKAVTLAPDQLLLKVNLAQSLVAVEDEEFDEEAKEILTAVLAKDKDYSSAWHQLAIVQERRGESGLASLASAERYALLGAMPYAINQARRAQSLLPHGSAGWLRSADILAEAEAAIRAQKRR
ncbi:MAG: M48 family metalloprotease [Alphaproteobacteria bacterium]